jgi:hypothetical protein
MAAQVLTDLTAQVARNTEVEASATTLISGIADRIAAAVAAASSPMARPPRSSPRLAEVDALKASSQALADAVAANTRRPAGAGVMPEIVITQELGPEGEAADPDRRPDPAEPALLLLVQAIEILRTQVIAKAVQHWPPSITLASALPGNGMPPGTHGIQGGDMQFRKGTTG